MKRLLKVSEGELKQLLTQSAEVGYRFDLDRFGVEGVPFEENTVLQQIVAASVNQATADFKNLTQTLGMVDPYGKALPLQDVYRNCIDFAYEQVATGAVDYNTAIREATRNIARYGVRTINYESGVTRSLEAAVRGSIMGGLGLMQEQISQRTHDEMGADGWEISAHAASAPDHEPIQGKQYSDAEYTALNNSLVRRIGTLNCGHAAFPIILGASEPQYSEKELEEFRAANEKGITYEGKHYTMYEATQMQRKLERSMRTTKRKILADEKTKDEENLLYDQIRLRRINEEYIRFSKAADLPLQRERMQVDGFDRSRSTSAIMSHKSIAFQADSMYNIGSTDANIDALLRDRPVRQLIMSGKYPLTIHKPKQRKHILGTKEYVEYSNSLKSKNKYGPSRLTVSEDDAQILVDKYCGTGIILRNKNGEWRKVELITIHPDDIGIAVNDMTGVEANTSTFKIHYSKDGTHVVPDYPSKKGAKANK